MYCPKQLVPALVGEVVQRAHTQAFNSQQASNILWGLSILGACDLPTWDVLTAQYCHITATPEELPEEALTQVHNHTIMIKST
jgi:hypothetical protein